MSAASDFWSRRRARVRAEAETDERLQVEAEERAAVAEFDDLPEAEILERLGLPDPDTLVRGDDFAAFMARNVPDYLRRRALRRLWRSDPALACVDGLNDYDTDFRGGGVATGTLKTAYRVGKGLVRDLDVLGQKVGMAAGPDVADDPRAPENAAGRPSADAELTKADDAEERRGPPVAKYSPAEDEMQTPRRRMSFSFDDGDGASNGARKGDDERSG